LTLYTTPVIYLTLDRIGAGITRWWSDRNKAGPVATDANPEPRSTFPKAAE
jgi:hypothetical protein